jgi:hypothetical protein
MTTAVTSPAGSGARASEDGTAVPGRRAGRRRWRRAVHGGLVLLAVTAGCVVAGTDLSARSATHSAQVSLAAVTGRLGAVRRELAASRIHLAAAQAGNRAATRSFDNAQSTLSATQAALARDQAGITTDGVDLGTLDSCLAAVEQALNQLAVGQTAGGLASLRASSASCSILDKAG